MIMMKQSMFCNLAFFGVVLSSSAVIAAEITVEGDVARLKAGVLTREIELSKNSLRTTGIAVDGKQLLARTAREFVLRVRRASPNACPVGLKPGEGEALDSVLTFRKNYKEDPARWEDNRPGAVRWVEPLEISSDNWSKLAGKPRCKVDEPKTGVQRLDVAVELTDKSSFGKLTVTLCYEVYAGHPVIRKWVEIKNTGDRWLMLDQMTIDDLHLGEAFLNAVPLTPHERGAESSIIAFGNTDQSMGVIAGSEVPSALRTIGKDGSLGYREKWFEWVIGPGETFVSEPVFLYAYCGPVQKTISARSTPLDRAVEGHYMAFLREHLGVGPDTNPLHGPQWMTWAGIF
ncbi:MAG: hypothetical protein JXM70_20735, partial [Pirellulales bacterium]|nr:hypothetical protein [Pirellulales bacterium]